MVNTAHFTLLAGNPSKWDEETRRLCTPGRYADTYDSPGLIKVQVDQHRRGRRGAILTKTFKGWSVRASSGLDAHQVLFVTETREGRDQAIAWGVAWANQDPDNREFIARKDDL
jgi:hypothetical protein